ncbi:MAG: hypothetical protein IJI67_00450 [Clostridia bacterium]|nr:hypothetical protein [Clostridia bacterium]
MKKIYRLLPFLLIVAIGILSIRLFVVFVPKRAQKADTAKGVSYVHALEEIGGNKADSIVKKAQEKYEGAERRKKIAAAIKEGNYEYAFKDVLIVGDSIMKAIYEYGILDSSQVMAEIGAGTAYLEDMTDDIVAANPKVLVLHFGENQISGEANAAAYAKEYGAIVAALKEKLPDTEIYVDSIFPVSDAAVAAEPYLSAIGAYNEELKKMAKDVGVHYIDYDSMWASFDKNYYDLDGIHPVSSFYSEQFLPYVLTEVGLNVD